jgi:CHAT domain-containing protein
LQVFLLPAKSEIEKTARAFYGKLRARTEENADEAAIEQADAQADRLAAELSRIILGPAGRAGLLRKESTILVVSDGALQYIPFSALPLPSSLPGRPVLMVEEHEIVHLPSASVLASLREEFDHREPPARTLALIADPVFEREDGRFRERPGDLKPAGFLGQLLSPRAPALRRGLDGQGYTRLHWSKEEADRILRLIPRSQVFEARDFAASVATVTRAPLDQYRLLHFATHGRIDSSRPERSSLVLSLYNRDGEQQDGFLRLADVYNLRLNADLVVLSACETALGKEMRGEGLIGLTRGFMLAGSRRVLASLWSVDDRVTAELMERLYRNMLKEGRSPAAALRQAQRDMLRDKDWKSPYYWAGFSLQGEWR